MSSPRAYSPFKQGLREERNQDQLSERSFQEKRDYLEQDYIAISPSSPGSSPRSAMYSNMTQKFTDSQNTPASMGPQSAFGRQSAKVSQDAHRRLACRVLHVDEYGILKSFRTYDELSEYLVNSAVKDEPLDSELESRLSKATSMSLSSLTHYATVGEYLRYLYEQDKFMDVHITVDGHIFSAHRLALCCHSVYFSEIFLNKDRKIPFSLKLDGISAEAFATFLEFVYTGEIKVYPEIASDLILVADHLHVAELQEKFQYLAQQIPLRDAIIQIIRGGQGAAGRLYRSISDKILSRFLEVVKDDAFLDLDIDVLCELLSSDDLVVSTEYEVFTASLRWVVHNIEERIKYAMRVLSCVRFCYMTQEELFVCAETTSLTRGYDKFKESVLIANWLLTARRLNREDPFHFPVPPPRKCYQHLVFLGSESHHAKSNNAVQGQQRMEPLSRVMNTVPEEEYSFPEPIVSSTPKDPGDKERLVFKFPDVGSTPTPNAAYTPIPDARSAPTRKANDAEVVFKFPTPPLGPPPEKKKRQPSPVSANSKPKKFVDILVIGGFQTSDKVIAPGNSITVSPTPTGPVSPGSPAVSAGNREKDWVQFCQLPEPRHYHVVTTMADKVYIIGGSDPRITGKLAPTKTVFMMDLHTKKWQSLTDMNVARMCHCACALYGLVYVFGGKGANGELLDSVECYNMHTGMWSFVAPLPTARMGSSAAILNGTIYVTGGLAEGVLNTVDQFSPQSNSWTQKGQLRIPRCHANLVNAKGRLFLCGGMSEINNPGGVVMVSVSSVDEYNADDDTWTQVTDMIIPRHEAAAIVVGNRIYLMGGVTSPSERVLKSIECYDVRQGTWLSGIQELPFPARWIGCASILSRR